MTVNPNNYQRIFGVGRTRSGSVYYPALHKSVNSGSSWTKHTVVSNSQIHLFAVAVNPANDNIIYAGGTTHLDHKGVLYRSNNGGSSWTALGTGVFPSRINSLAVDPVRPNRVFAGTSSGLYRSLNSGGSWTRVMTHDVKDIRINPQSPDEMFTGGSSGVYSSRDGGSTWTEFNDGLSFRNVLCLEWDTANKNLYAGTQGGSAFKHGDLDRRVLNLAAANGGTTEPAPGTHFYSTGASVTIRAIPDAHFLFTGWSGDLSGTQNPAVLVMNTDKSVTANFIRRIYAPLNASGVKRVNRSLFMIEYINILTWEAHPDNDAVTSYRIYAIEGGDRRLLHETGAGVFEFRQRNVARNEDYHYQIVAVDGGGREGDPASVSVR